LITTISYFVLHVFCSLYCVVFRFYCAAAFWQRILHIKLNWIEFSLPHDFRLHHSWWCFGLHPLFRGVHPNTFHYAARNYKARTDSLAPWVSVFHRVLAVDSCCLYSSAEFNKTLSLSSIFFYPRLPNTVEFYGSLTFEETPCTKHFSYKYVDPAYCRARNVRWPRRMLPPPAVESRWICAARSIKVRKRRDRQTDGRMPNRYITLTDRRNQRNNGLVLNPLSDARFKPSRLSLAVCSGMSP